MTTRLPEPQLPLLPPAIGPAPSPFWPQHLIDLFFRPTRFFSGQLALGRTPYVALVTWAFGISSVLDRIDMRMLQAELSDDPERWQVLEALIGDWPRLWAVVLASGAVSGILLWWIGGWWCRVRLRWSGAEDPDTLLPRLLLIYSSFVFAGPVVLALVAQTLLYPNYRAAFEAESSFDLLVLSLVFWSLFTTYKGALALFSVSRARARLWFIALPAVFYFLVAGGAAVLFGGRT